MLRRTGQREQLMRSAEYSQVRLLAVLAALAGAALLEHSVSEELPYFALGAVLFTTALLAMRLPEFFWNGSRDAQRESEQAEPALDRSDR